METTRSTVSTEKIKKNLSWTQFGLFIFGFISLIQIIFKNKIVNLEDSEDVENLSRARWYGTVALIIISVMSFFDKVVKRKNKAHRRVYRIICIANAVLIPLSSFYDKTFIGVIHAIIALIQLGLTIELVSKNYVKN